MAHIFVLQNVENKHVVTVKGFEGWPSKEEARLKLEEFQAIVGPSGRTYTVKAKSV